MNSILEYSIYAIKPFLKRGKRDLRKNLSTFFGTYCNPQVRYSASYEKRISKRYAWKICFCNVALIQYGKFLKYAMCKF